MDSEITFSPAAARLNAERAKYHIRKLDNPNPVIIISIIAVLIIGIYLIYILLIKVNIGGQWLSEKNKTQIKINHCKFTDNIRTETNCGYVNGNVIYLYNKDAEPEMGIINSDKIFWLNGDVWFRCKFC